MPISVKTITHLVTLSRWSYENARDRQEIQDKIKNHGYDVLRMDSLIESNTQMDNKYLEQQTVRSQQAIAYKNFASQFTVERKQCKNVRLLVRNVILETEYEKYDKLLGLDEPLKKNYEGFYEQARKLYNHLQDDNVLLTRLFQYNETAETFQERLNALNILNDLHKKYETAKGLTQVATRDRDNLFRKFYKEWSDFKDICKIAYGDDENPEYQELVGIKSYSPGYEKPSENGSDKPEPDETPAPTDTKTTQN
ncbi:MAG: hypothetical protein QG657_1113 [Acidobacteriota bacterium]|nr:hypothetical protein [Acidobacteriota bacterium]